jgi:hypothetical protein
MEKGKEKSWGRANTHRNLDSSSQLVVVNL